jgi:hypothetical protein
MFIRSLNFNRSGPAAPDPFTRPPFAAAFREQFAIIFRKMPQVAAAPGTLFPKGEF